MDKKEYSNGDITVVWNAEKCIHSANCVKGLSTVFKPDEKPWIQLETASSEEIMSTIDKCPSGALSYYKNGEKSSASPTSASSSSIELIPNGPIIVHGSTEIKSAEGNAFYEGPRTVLCRCGASEKSPFCDGSHKKIGFKA